MSQASAKKEAMDQDAIQDLAITILPIKKLQKHPDNEAMWGKKGKDTEALAKIIKKTKIIDPLLVMKSGENCWTILSGHSRYDAAKSLGIKDLPCRIIKESLNETEQLLWIIAFNTGHAANKGMILKSAVYCAKKNKNIDPLSMLEFCGAGENSERWATVINKVVAAVAKGGKNRARTIKTAVKAAEAGIEAAEASIKRSEEISGTKDASPEESSDSFPDQKSVVENDLQELKAEKQSDEIKPILGFVTPLAESFVVPVSEIPKISEAAASRPVVGMKATVKSLNRDMYAAGLLETKQAKFAMETLLALAEGEPMPEAPSKAVIENLQKQLAETKEMADDNGKAFNIAEGVVNKLLRQAVQAYLSQTRRDGYVTVDAMRLRDELVNEAKFDLMSMNPDDLQASLEAAMRQEN